jgi:hypothetical protein
VEQKQVAAHSPLPTHGGNQQHQTPQKQSNALQQRSTLWACRLRPASVLAKSRMCSPVSCEIPAHARTPFTPAPAPCRHPPCTITAAAQLHHSTSSSMNSAQQQQHRMFTISSSALSYVSSLFPSDGRGGSTLREKFGYTPRPASPAALDHALFKRLGTAAHGARVVSEGHGEELSGRVRGVCECSRLILEVAAQIAMINIGQTAKLVGPMLLTTCMRGWIKI